MTRWVYVFARGLTRVTESVAALLLLGIVLINVLQVIFRYVIGIPVGWTEEVMRYSVIWVTFLASAAALYRHEHMTIDIAGSLLTSRLARRALHVLVLACIGFFCFMLAWEGIPLGLRNASQFSPSARIPMIWPYIAVAVGGVLMLLKVICLLLLPPHEERRLLDEEARL